MMHGYWWMSLFATLVALWQETGENPALFCYRICSGSCYGLAAHAFVPAPVRKFLDSSTARNNSECLTSFSTFFTRFSIPKD